MHGLRNIYHNLKKNQQSKKKRIYKDEHVDMSAFKSTTNNGKNVLNNL